MKILVTGGAGYIGSVLVPMLLNDGYDVRVFDNLSYGQSSMLPYFIDDHFEFIKGDIRDVKAVKKAVDGTDAIIHLAAIVGAPGCNKDPVLAREVNYQGTVNVNRARTGQKLIYASTGSVYGKVDGICTEKSPANPLSVYGETKLMAEKEVLRSGNAIAYRFATAFGLSSKLRLDLLPNYFVFNALKDKHLVIYDRDFKRTFVHVKDIARSYLFGLKHFAAMKNKVYNVGSEKINKTKGEIADLMREKIDFEIYCANENIPDPDQRDYEVSYQKIRDIGFKTKISFERGVDEMINGLKHLDIKNPYSNV
ncbi:MAG TPA: NAD(P)-dependent oxidoreductase [Candidatus Paceibacterota bacterium]